MSWTVPPEVLSRFGCLVKSARRRNAPRRVKKVADKPFASFI